MGALLREMQSSLFELRLSGQALDSLSLQPLDETMARIAQQVRHLSHMCANADGTLAKHTYNVCLCNPKLDVARALGSAQG